MERSALSPGVVAALDGFENGEFAGGGFAAPCEPVGDCSEYVAMVTGDKVSTVFTLAGVKEFLGEIDCPEDVLLLVTAWGAEGGLLNSAHVDSIKPDDHGYTVLVHRSADGTMPDCVGFPLDTYRELIHVSRTGAIDVLARKVLSQECVMM